MTSVAAALSHLDRDELIALVERFCPTSGVALLQARIDAAIAREQALLEAWRAAARRASVDAQAALRWSDTHGYDSRFAEYLALAKKSTRASSEARRVCLKQARRRQALELDLKLARKAVA
jgi:hypothetical protein